MTTKNERTHMTVCVQIWNNGQPKRIQVPANDIEIEIDEKKQKLIDFLLTTTERIAELEKKPAVCIRAHLWV